MKQTIPVLDLQDFIRGSASQRTDFVQTLGRALEEIGFFAIANHGVDSGLIEKAYSLSRGFFDLPVDTKRKYEIEGMKGQRGYTSFGKEHAKDSKAPDLKEFWHVGPQVSEAHPMYKEYPQNVWVQELADFKPTLLQLYQQLEECSMRLLEACSLFIDRPQNFLRQLAEDGNSILRIIHYPPVPEDAHPASIRAAAHEDINLITLLCESTAGGLELLQRDGSWLPVHSLQGQIIVDSGDMIQNLTNGLFKSTTHRVVNPDDSRERRFSMPFFVHPRSEVSLSPLKECVDRTGGQKRFPDILAGEYLEKRLQEIGMKG